MLSSFSSNSRLLFLPSSHPKIRRRCTALPPSRALFSSRKVEETGKAQFATKTRMANPASAAAPPPALAEAAPAPAAAAVNPSSAGPASGAAAPAPYPHSSSKRERERGGNNGMPQQHQQQRNNNTAAANADASAGDDDNSEGPKKRGRRSKRPLTPETLLRKEVHASARRQDARAALAAYDAYLELLRGENARARERATAKAAGGKQQQQQQQQQQQEEGGDDEPTPPYYHSPLWDPQSSLVHLSSDVRNSLLYLCAGGDAWDAELAGPEARARRRAASGSVGVLGSGAAAAAGAAAPAASAAPPSSSSHPPPLPAEELARRGREIFDRTTNCLMDVERPLLLLGRRSGGAAGDASAAAASAGAASGVAAAAAAPPPPAADGNNEPTTTAFSGGGSDGEMAFTALARMAARARDPRGSLAAAREAVARGHPARLRSFSPAILAFAVEGDAASAFEVEREAREEHGLEMTEPELGFLASAAAAAEAAEAAAAAEANTNSSSSSSSLPSRSGPCETVESGVLAVLTREHGRLQRETVAALESYFSALGNGGGSGGDGDGEAEGGQEEKEKKKKRKWRVGRARVDPRTGGVLVPCPSSPPSSPDRPSSSSDLIQDNLGPVDLEPHEWDAFSEGVAALARNRERSPQGAFDAFVDWCAANGPFDAVVDGANVALYGQNWAHGDFSFAQLEAVVEELKRRLGPGSKTLVVLHRSRLLSPPARDADGRRVLGSFASEAAAAAAPSTSSGGAAPQQLPAAQVMLYAAPHGSNDDWYWLHAAVAAGERGLVVSNDEMRDHVFQLLSPRFAARWKDRHRAKYTFHGNYHLGSAALYNNRNSSSYGHGYGSGGYGSSGIISAQLFFPPPFSECSQKVPKTGAWLFPRAVAAAGEGEEAEEAGKRGGGEGGEGGEGDDDPDEWLCCSPVSS